MAITDEITTLRIICEGGLNNNENSLTLAQESPGSAVRLINYESSISGGYRRINGYGPYDLTAQEVGIGIAEGRVLSVVAYFNSVTKVYDFIATRKLIGSNTYAFFRLNSGIGWTQIVTPIRNMSGTFREVEKVRFEQFNFGSGNHIIFVDGVNPALWFNGTDWVEILSTNIVPTAAAPGGSQVVDAPYVIAIFKNHIFFGGDLSPDGEGRIVHSSPNTPIDWTPAQGAGQIFPGFNSNGLKPFRNELYVFGQERIRKAIPDVTAGFVLQDVTNDLGCMATDSILELAGNLIFLSQDGIRPIAGTDKINDVELGLLSEDIQPTMDNLISTIDFTTLNSVVVKKKTQFRYTWGNDTIDVSLSNGLIGSVRTNQRIGRNWEFGKLLGIRTSCMWSGMVAAKEIVLHGDYDGKVYRQEQGTSFNGLPIYSIYSTPYLDMGDTDVRKELREVKLFLDTEGAVDITLGLSFDWDMDDELLEPADYIIPFGSGNSVYDNPTTIYDNSNTIYGGSARSVKRQHIQGSVFSVQFNYVNNSTGASFTIQGFIPEFSIKGRQ